VSSVTFTGATAAGVTVASAAITRLSGTTIRLVVPAGALPGPIRVTGPAGSTIFNGLLVLAAPVVTATQGTAVTAVLGTAPVAAANQTAIGKTVTITGAGFVGVTGITIGAARVATFTVVSGTSITAVVPAGTPNGAAAIAVTTAGGIATMIAIEIFGAIEPPLTFWLQAPFCRAWSTRTFRMTRDANASMCVRSATERPSAWAIRMTDSLIRSPVDSDVPRSARSRAAAMVLSSGCSRAIRTLRASTLPPCHSASSWAVLGSPSIVRAPPVERIAPTRSQCCFVNRGPAQAVLASAEQTADETHQSETFSR
jgi:hypothetical protein